MYVYLKIFLFLNFQVRAALLKSLSVYLSIRGHHDWTFRRRSMFSAAYNTGADYNTEAAPCHEVLERYNLQTIVEASEPNTPRDESMPVG